ncbi:hypothetical protein [Asaia bogorensis]|uniref:hypothetical protein n=1 Tax=Asaia bogorensis TaxID=91915 RepID=UPI00285A7853|nr:hypothetical protein [Asaia bogorensis]MDR6183172.1 hypothetical protein [Asaia bogorensis NBRC 16594]
MTGRIRSWQVRLLVDGTSPEGVHVCGFRLQCTRYERCDTAHIVIAAKDGSALFSRLTGRSGFDRPDIELQVIDRLAGEAGWRSVFHGALDAITRENDPVSFRLECRDYLCFLLDTRLTRSWSNQTAIEIVQQAAQAAGLEFQSDLNGSDIAGDYYCGQFWQLEHRRLSASAQHRYQTAFDLAFSLARDHGYECQARGRAIIINRPPDADSGQIFEPDGMTMQHFRYDFGLSGAVSVGVRSWDSRQRARSEIFYDGQEFSTEPPASGAALYTFRGPGLRMDDIKRLAQGKHRRIVSHACEARLSLPAIAGLEPRHFMKLGGEMIDRPRTLSVDAVDHFFDLSQGYRQEVTLRDRIF